MKRQAQHESWMLRYMTAEPREGWQNLAACKDTNLELWYDNTNHPKECLSVCQTCPVRMDCGADAYSFEQHTLEFIFGVRAGMPPGTRQRLYRRFK